MWLGFIIFMNSAFTFKWRPRKIMPALELRLIILDISP